MSAPRTLRLTPLESTLLLGPDEPFIPADPLVGEPAYRIVKADLPPRRAVSIEEFERDMLAARPSRSRVLG